MTLAVASLVMAAALGMYLTLHSNQRTADALNQMNIITSGVRRVYGSAATFAGLSNATLITTRIVPAGMVDRTGTVLHNSFGGGIDVVPFTQGGVPDAGFQISFAGVPADSCVVMTTKDLGASLAGIVVNSTTFDYDTDGMPGVAAAGQACGSSPSTVVWKFRN